MKSIAAAVAALYLASFGEAFTSPLVQKQQGNAFVSKQPINSELQMAVFPPPKKPLLKTTELTDKFYFEKEAPKILGGIKIGTRELVVITGASSGLGRNCASVLAKTGRYFVVMACRDVEKGKAGTILNSCLLF